jgi:hypothetical protein
MSTQPPFNPKGGTPAPSVMGMSFQANVTVGSNEPRVIMSIGSSSYLLTCEIAMAASSNMAAAANMASLQAMFRRWLENHTDDSEVINKLIAEFNAEVVLGASSEPASSERPTPIRPTTKRDS